MSITIYPLKLSELARNPISESEAKQFEPGSTPPSAFTRVDSSFQERRAAIQRSFADRKIKALPYFWPEKEALINAFSINLLDESLIYAIAPSGDKPFPYALYMKREQSSAIGGVLFRYDGQQVVCGNRVYPSLEAFLPKEGLPYCSF